MAASIAKRRRLLDLSIRETSGVDHPANNTQVSGAEGWLVMKADGSPATVEDLIRVWPSRAEEFAQAELERQVARAREVRASANRTGANRPAATPPAPVASAGGRDGSASSPLKARELQAVPVPVTKSTTMATVRQEAEKFRVARAAAGELLTMEQATAKVLELRPELVERYRSAAPAPEPADRATLSPGAAHVHVAALDSHVEKLAKGRGIAKADAYAALDAQGFRLLAVVKQAQGRHLEAKRAREAADHAG